MSVPAGVLQAHLDRYRAAYRQRTTQVRELRAQLKECRAKYANLKRLYDGQEAATALAKKFSA